MIAVGGCAFFKRPVLIGPNGKDVAKKVVLIPGQKAVVEKNKQVFYFDGKTQVQLTQTGSNHEPVLSPGGDRVLFTRKSSVEAMIPVEGDGFNDPEDAFSDQLWVMDIVSRKEKLLVNDLPWPQQRQEIETGRLLPWIGNAQFSADGQKIYFTAPVWVTSSGLYVVPVDGGEAKFITDTNYLKVIDRGEYKGDLILSQHRYFLYGGSYDWCYIFSPEGKEIAVLSEDPDGIDWERLYSEEVVDKDENAGKGKH